jgi:hypothetical protein
MIAVLGPALTARKQPPTARPQGGRYLACADHWTLERRWGLMIGSNGEGL